MRKVITTAVLFLIRMCQLPWFVARGSHVAWSARVERGCTVVRTRLGRHVYVGSGVVLTDCEVGAYASIAAGAKIGGMEHSWWWGAMSPAMSNQGVSGVCTVVGEDVWVGSNAVIRQGVTLGRGCVVGAGAVVLSDVPPYGIVAGVPARVLRMRFDAECMAAVEATKFWELPPAPGRARLTTIPYPMPAAGRTANLAVDAER